MDEIRILQIGKEDWHEIYILPETVCLDYVSTLTEIPSIIYNLVFLDKTPGEMEIQLLYAITKTYTLFITEKTNVYDQVAWLCNCKKAKYIKRNDIQKFLDQESRYYYTYSYGEKFKLKDLAISRNFLGYVKWNGNCNVNLEGDFGDDFCQIAFWRNNIPLSQGRSLDLWLEYKKSPEIDISLNITVIREGSASDILNKWEFSEAELENVVQIESKQANGFMFAALHAKGRGKLQIIALHDRYSRGRHGYFLPGGGRYVTSDREEIFCYFDPGDLKPPLNVYFSGYKTQQGFEGYNLMRNMGCPFLLLSESRLEGGCLYIGSKEYERLVVTIIRKYMSELGFVSDQVIMSGISGGTYGALYYGCDIRPHAMILGKPVPNLGNIAANEKYLRPGGFPTSLDMLLYLCGSTDAEAVERLNNKFWSKFDLVDWGKSKFIISYMIEDDYDPQGYESLISHLWSSGVQVYGKGVHGRHNDNTQAIVSWFSSQYQKILEEDFFRRIEKK